MNPLPQVPQSDKSTSAFLFINLLNQGVYRDVERMNSEALKGIRICDFTGQLAGAGATKWLASFGAEVIRIEDPIRQGRWIS